MEPVLKLTELNEATNIKDKDLFDISKDMGGYFLSHKITFQTLKNILRDIIGNDVRLDNAYTRSMLYPMLQAELCVYDKVWRANHPEKIFTEEKGKVTKHYPISPYQIKSKKLYDLVKA